MLDMQEVVGSIPTRVTISAEEVIYPEWREPLGQRYWWAVIFWGETRGRPAFHGPGGGAYMLIEPTNKYAFLAQRESTTITP